MNLTSILNGTIVAQGEIYRADIVLADGVIAEICQPGRRSPVGNTVDAQGCYVLPGAIDIHFHCRAPAYPQRGDFATETRAAAVGGVTTILEMPISRPGVATVEILEARRALGEQNAYVDFGLYAGPALLDPAGIAKMVDAGAIGFKVFLIAPPVGREDEFTGICLTSEADLYRLFQLIKPYSLPVVFHAENNTLLDYFSRTLQESGRVDAISHALSRPPVVEAAAIALLLTISEATGRSIHIAHLSSAAGLNLIRDARRRGVRVTTETCPHYLWFTSEKLQEAGPFAKINPPIRDEADRQALWAGLMDGTIDVVTTDHSPFTLVEKEAGLANIWAAPPGTPSVEVLYPLLLDQALRGRLSLHRVLELVAMNPARLYNLHPQKGMIQVGSDADLVVFDPNATLEVDRHQWQSKAAACDRLYSGMVLKGRIREVIARGRLVARLGQVTGLPGHGRFVRPVLGQPLMAGA
jgi:allantoinase